MSPEYSNINEAPSYLKTYLRESLKREFECAIQQSDLFIKVLDGQVRDLLIDYAPDGVKKDARKSRSAWHWVHPLYDSYKYQKAQESYRNDDQPIGGGGKIHGPHKGNHRSGTKGAGIKALRRKPVRWG